MSNGWSILCDFGVFVSILQNNIKIQKINHSPKSITWQNFLDTYRNTACVFQRLLGLVCIQLYPPYFLGHVAFIRKSSISWGSECFKRGSFFEYLECDFREPRKPKLLTGVLRHSTFGHSADLELKNQNKKLKFKDSVIEDSVIEDSNIEDFKIEDSKIKDTKIALK